ncbi:hypothetical protein [Aquaspirillum sp. LM1]|uniref:hypothetical protein n=1 Tax=Aquaspirillum sp. LM1 TaxID=1938604 RepID=UPI0012372A0B|nr:hypothetical protein [Aquaspirillum sp. LM1]
MNAAFKRRISNKFQAGSVPRFFCQCKPVAGIRGKGWSKRHTLLYQVTGYLLHSAALPAVTIDRATRSYIAMPIKVSAAAWTF